MRKRTKSLSHWLDSPREIGIRTQICSGDGRFTTEPLRRFAIWERPASVHGERPLRNPPAQWLQRLCRENAGSGAGSGLLDSLALRFLLNVLRSDITVCARPLKTWLMTLAWSHTSVKGTLGSPHRAQPDTSQSNKDLHSNRSKEINNHRKVVIVCLAKQTGILLPRTPAIEVVTFRFRGETDWDKKKEEEEEEEKY